MPTNTIALFKSYVPLLDQVYKLAALTSVLDGPAEMVRAGANAGEIVVPIMSMQGLVNYAKNGGTTYTEGNVVMTNQTYTCGYNRGRIFSVDTLENQETAGIAFGRLAGEFIRTKVAPEIDAYRLSAYASKANIGGPAAAADLSTGADVVAALRAGTEAMDEAEVPLDQRYLFITPTLYGLVEDMDTTKSRAVISRFQQVIQVPQSRMVKGITLANSGDGGYSKGTGAKNINFMIVHKPAVIQYNKHVAPKVVTPEQNQVADAWKFGYRVCGIADVYASKLQGIYAHIATT